jgi:hypothetical protein
LSKNAFPAKHRGYIPHDAPIRAYDVIIDSLDFDELRIEVDPHKVGCLLRWNRKRLE